MGLNLKKIYIIQLYDFFCNWRYIYWFVYNMGDKIRGKDGMFISKQKLSKIRAIEASRQEEKHTTDKFKHPSE